MSSDLVQYLLKEAWVLGCRTVTFGGLGEPTMHPDFYQLLSWAKEIGYSIEFTSNGWTLAPEKLSMLDRSDVVRISIDTMHLQGSPHPQDYLKKMKILFTKIPINFKMIAITHGDFTSDIQMMFLENKISVRYYPLAKKARSASPEKMRTSLIPCLYPWYSITVHVDNTLGPCPCSNWFSIGELNEKIKLADFWNGNEMNNFRSQHRNGNLPELCKICDLASRDTSEWIKALLRVS
jgi:MoaA/NifB/PqqE/SkfB family radical SAM enzyme